MAPSFLYLTYGRSLPCEVYHELLADARGQVSGIRCGDEDTRRIAQVNARFFLTSGCLDWRSLCAAAGIECVEDVLAAHRKEFGIVTAGDVLRFAGAIWGERVKDYPEVAERLAKMRDAEGEDET